MLKIFGTSLYLWLYFCAFISTFAAICKDVQCKAVWVFSNSTYKIFFSTLWSLLAFEIRVIFIVIHRKLYQPAGFYEMDGIFQVCQSLMFDCVALLMEWEMSLIRQEFEISFSLTCVNFIVSSICVKSLVLKTAGIFFMLHIWNWWFSYAVLKFIIWKLFHCLSQLGIKEYFFFGVQQLQGDIFHCTVWCLLLHAFFKSHVDLKKNSLF